MGHAMMILGSPGVVRFRANSPRLLLLYRAIEKQPRKRMLKGEKGKIEILGHGQQFVAFGQHPDGAHYEWDAELPERDSLPTASEDQITAFFKVIAPLFGACGDNGTISARGRVMTAATMREAVSPRPINPDELIERIKAGDHWHDNMLSLTGHWVSKGRSDTEILVWAELLTLAGWTVEQTCGEMLDMIAGARKKGFDQHISAQNADAAFAAVPLPKGAVDGGPCEPPSPELPPLIVHAHDRPATVRALRSVLARAPDLFDRGGVPVMLTRPADRGPPTAKSLTFNIVVYEAHRYCQPVTLNSKGALVPITLPDGVARMYLDRGEWGLHPLAGISTAPLLTEDGAILTNAGYDGERGLWCEAPLALAVPDRPTRADAEAALAKLRHVFRTFPFADTVRVPEGDVLVVDAATPPGTAESSFLAALLTAVCRPSLWLAPGLLISAPEVSGAGSGKGLLARAICVIAYGAEPAAFTPGHDRAELDKRLTAELIGAAPSLMLDNCNSTALRSDTLASVLTERPARVRLLGVSEMVPLNCTAFIVITGNGLSVSEDLARRFLNVEPRPAV